MSDSTLVEPYQIKPISPKEKPLVLRFLREFFYEEEPLNSYFYRTQKDSLRYLDRGIYAANCVDEELSLMAVTPSGRIIALTLNENVSNEPEVYMPETNPIFPKIKKIVSETEDQITALAGLLNNNEKEMRLKVMCIHPEWRNKGLGKVLLNHTRDVAKKNGCRQIRSTCTSAYSAKMFANFGFECVYTLNYEDYKVNGEIVFRPLHPHTAMKAMVLKL